MPSTDQLERVQACIVINPNNPTGVHYQKQDLLKVHKMLSDNNAWLIVDEAFTVLAIQSYWPKWFSTTGVPLPAKWTDS